MPKTDRSVCGAVCRGCGKYRTNVDEETGLCIAGGRYQRAAQAKQQPNLETIAKVATEAAVLRSFLRYAEENGAADATLRALASGFILDGRGEADRAILLAIGAGDF